MRTFACAPMAPLHGSSLPKGPRCTATPSAATSCAQKRPSLAEKQRPARGLPRHRLRTSFCAARNTVAEARLTLGEGEEREPTYIFQIKRLNNLPQIYVI